MAVALSVSALGRRLRTNEAQPLRKIGAESERLVMAGMVRNRRSSPAAGVADSRTAAAG
jgi:hypothetical protein